MKPIPLHAEERKTVIGEHTQFTGTAVAVIISAVVFIFGAQLAIYSRIWSLEQQAAVDSAKLDILSDKVNQIAQQIHHQP